MSSPGTVEGDERLRLFCALRLPEPVLDTLERWQETLVLDGRIVPRGNLHITVAFLGSRPAGDLAVVADALREAAAVSGEFRFSPVRYRETRSVGMVVLDDETGEGTTFAERVFSRLEAAGVYERERRPWLPHVTVVRFQRPARIDPPLPGLGSFRSSDAAVYMSVLRPTGAQYRVLESVPLGG